MTDRPDKPKGERIAKILARAGVASRREVERMIADGRIALNGKILETPATLVRNAKGITVDGNPVQKTEAARLWRYYKPKGLVTTHRDPRGRPTVFEKLPQNMPRVVSVGRLDINSEGLLLLTNDGGLARYLELPANGWDRTYRARAYGRATTETLAPLAGGVEIEGVRYGPVQAAIDTNQAGNLWLTVTIQEGKNREVRKVLEHVGLTVNRLIRIGYGPFKLGELNPEQLMEMKSLHQFLPGYFKQPAAAEKRKPAGHKGPNRNKHNAHHRRKI